MEMFAHQNLSSLGRWLGTIVSQAVASSSSRGSKLHLNYKYLHIWATWRVTRLGDFANFLVTNFITKVAQMFGDFLQLWKPSLFKWNWSGYFWGNFWKNLGYFLFHHLVALAAHVCIKFLVFSFPDLPSFALFILPLLLERKTIFFFKGSSRG